MLEATGIIFALIAAVCWGSQFVPLKKIRKPDAAQFHVFMSVGIFLLSLAIALVLKFNIVFNLLAIVSGLVWGLGNLLYIHAVNRIGLAKAAPVIHGTSIIASFAIGITFFSEALTSLVSAIGGIALLVLGIRFVAVGKQKRTNLIGLLLGSSSGLVFASIFTMLKISQLPASDFLFPMALGILAGALAVTAVKRMKLSIPQIRNSLLSGAIWSVGNFFGLSATILLGLAVGFPLTQTAVVFAALWGLLYFREVKEKRDKLKILIGALILIMGAFLLSFSKF